MRTHSSNRLSIAAYMAAYIALITVTLYGAHHLDYMSFGTSVQPLVSGGGSAPAHAFSNQATRQQDVQPCPHQQLPFTTATTGTYAQSEHLDCSWNFLKYHLSEYEIRWLDDIDVNQEAVCKQQNQFYQKYVDVYLASQKMLSPEIPPTPQGNGCSNQSLFLVPKKLPRETFSVFEYAGHTSNVVVIYQGGGGGKLDRALCQNFCHFIVLLLYWYVYFGVEAFTAHDPGVVA
jgi:hypothetical protein